MTRIACRLQSLFRAQRGIQTVEFALILPVLLLLVFGMIDFGRGYFSWLIITNGAREGARAAAVGKSVSVIDTKVRDAVSGLYITSTPCSTATGALCVTTVNAAGASGSPVTVNVRYNFSFLVVPGIASLVGGSLPNGVIPLNASATMRLE